jgi:hypothetical protein
MAAKYTVHTKYIVGTSAYDTSQPTLHYSEDSARKEADKLNTAYELGVADATANAKAEAKATNKEF